MVDLKFVSFVIVAVERQPAFVFKIDDKLPPKCFRMPFDCHWCRQGIGTRVRTETRELFTIKLGRTLLLRLTRRRVVGWFGIRSLERDLK